MKSNQVKTTIEKLGLNNKAVAELLGVTRQTIWAWRQNGAEGTSAILLHLLAAGKITIQDVEAAHGKD